MTIIAGRPPSGVAPDGVGHGGRVARPRRPAADPAAAADHAHRVQGARRLPARQRRPPAAARGPQRHGPRGVAGRAPRLSRAAQPHAALVAPRPTPKQHTSSLTCIRRPNRTSATETPRLSSPLLPGGDRVPRPGRRAGGQAPGLHVTGLPASDAFTGSTSRFVTVIFTLFPA